MAEHPDPVALRRTAMDLLARREHSRLELIQKLRRHCAKAAAGQDDAPVQEVVDSLIEATIDTLAAENLQSDERYAVSLIRSRVNRGQGPLRIRADLRERGLDDAMVEPLLEAYEEQWPELVARVVERRFGTEPAGDRREWARRARFLASRGFPESLAARVLGPLP